MASPTAEERVSGMLDALIGHGTLRDGLDRAIASALAEHARAAVEEEREACARLIEDICDSGPPHHPCEHHAFARSIRARAARPCSSPGCGWKVLPGDKACPEGHEVGT